MWYSPKGDAFEDPTTAVADAIVNSASLRDQFCGHLLAPWGRLTLTEYRARWFIRQTVDRMLEIAGYKRDLQG